MTILNNIKGDLIGFRKAQNRAAVTTLSTIIGECERQSKDADDATVSKVLRKMVSAIEENPKYQDDRDLIKERLLIGSYLERLMSEDDLTEIISVLYSQNPEIKLKDVMTHLKDNHGGKYDGKMAAQLAKGILQ